MADAPVAVIGGGVVGAAVAYTLARKGVPSVLLETEADFGLAASGTNSGIVHTGFDSVPGELETQMILRAGELRDPVLEELDVPIHRCGAVLRANDEAEIETVKALAANAGRNGVDVSFDGEALHVPGESITDPVAYTTGLIAAASIRGVDARPRSRVERIARIDDGLALAIAGGAEVTCRVAVNCAGLYADEVARLAGDDSFSIYPRKGEFFVFEPPEPLDQILLPVPTKRTKGVLVFPTIDGHVIAGPTAHDQDDKEDWTVRPSAYVEVIEKARAMWPALENAEPIASYAGLRTAGRDGVNYMIGPAVGCPELINVAAIRSTGLTASLGIGEYVAELVAAQGIELGETDTEVTGLTWTSMPWWRRTAQAKAVTM
ncbi:MAG TPA: FAD-dependent oxidoreductase [Thermoleophilaceae bacterium]